jgi:hypothetical protein
MHALLRRAHASLGAQRGSKPAAAYFWEKARRGPYFPADALELP